MAHTVFIRFTVFSNSSNLQFVLHILTFSKFLLGGCASCYGKHSLNHHFRPRAQSVYKTYSFLKYFEFAVCFAHFDFFKISTPVIRIKLTMAKSLNHHFRHGAHSAYKI